MAVSVRVKWSGTAQARKQLAELRKRMPAAVRRANRMEADDLLNEALTRVPVAEGRLRESGHVRQSRQGRGRFTNRWEVVFDAPHAVYIHEGIRGGFMPPVEPFARWAGIKLGDEALGFVVARAVGERGLQANRFLTDPAKARESGRASRMVARIQSGL